MKPFPLLLFLVSFLFLSCNQDTDQLDDGTVDISVNTDAPIADCPAAISSWSYQSILPPADGPIRNLVFKDPQFGIAIGNTGKIYRTTDGGINWPIVDNSLTTAGLFGVCIVEESVIYVGGFQELISTPAQKAAGEIIYSPAVFLSSKDGGTTWSKSYLEGFSLVTDLHFDDQNNGLAIMYKGSGGDDWFFGLYGTNDGGESWSEVALPISYPIHELLQVEGKLAVQGHEGLLIRDDVSKEWEERPYPAENCQVYFDGASTGLMRCFSPSGSVGYRTTDGGRTWETNDVPLYFRNLIHLAPDGTGLLIDQRQFVVGGDRIEFIGNIFYETTDAGLSWTVLRTDEDCGYGEFLYPVSDNRLI